MTNTDIFHACSSMETTRTMLVDIKILPLTEGFFSLMMNYMKQLWLSGICIAFAGSWVCDL